MSFIATAPPAAAGTSTDPLAIENDGWFPDIDLAHMRDAMRLDGTVTNERLAQAVIIAVLNVNGELDDWQKEKQEAGHLTMAAVPASTINRESRLTIHYRRAVYSLAKADLIERYRDIDSTATSLADKKSMEWMNDAPSEQRRNAHWAVADILGRTHATVELI
jgi:hypothetical protein